MKLELKHLASYLPYKLYILIKDDIFIEYNEFLEEEQYVEKGIYKLKGITEGTSYLEEGIFLSSTDKKNGDSFVEIKYIKPILFPLSSLTKEITIDGEKFIPIEVIMKSIGINGEITIDDEPCFGWDESYGDDAQGYAVCFNTEKLFFGVCYWEDIYEGIFTDKMLYELPFEHKQFQKLLEWKFDVFGLIEAGLAEPVTEEFNPYKLCSNTKA